MIWNFVGRRPLSVRDYVVSIKGGPNLGLLSCEITCQKFGDSLYDGMRPMKSWTSKSVFSL